ncbi:16S rRNA (adenine(1518)-N(6)/adenine(1519)-N(6))-dimethyltransferase RsmA [Buchnera aphidicola]|uniref:16S rRNA (adenine(1518)-N(6)/adenine(1519)-N(6))- dimethyltransferase RsmA n=1 Tax=Buchnera aphidicola TaxID=9 RepID=UPI0021C60AC6|nr:16S rRNA (adenine(1518)-N(6)/adenine(1519)-N(6))-dimethyltransferase RsmA [Buchnera aphidicola]
MSFLKLKKEEQVIEIGPGLGALTIPVSKLLKKLTVIEIDKELCKKMENNHNFNNVIIFNENAINFNLFKIKKSRNSLFRIFGNLPYNVSIPIIFSLFKHHNDIQDMHFMLQKEVVLRLVATLGSKFYNRLTVISQFYFNIKILKNISPNSFKPIPKVDSCFVSFKKKNDNLHSKYDINTLSFITKVAFNQRRKTICNSLSSLFPKKKLIKLGINPLLRAQNLSISQYCLLSKYLNF